MPVQTPSEATSVDTCARCGGRGWIVEDDGGVGTARACTCRGERLQTRRLQTAGIPLRYQKCRLGNFNTSAPDPSVQAQLAEAVTRCRRYVESFLETDGRFRESGLLFVGPPGGGKTHLAAAVLVELVERYRVRGRFVELTALFRRLQNTFDPGSPQSQREILDPILDAEVLVLDELGAQNPTAWVHDVLHLIVNTRYTQRRPTLFTTNYRLEDRPARRKGRKQASQHASRPTDYTTPLERQKPDPEPPPAPPAAESYRALLSHRLPPSLVSRLFEMAQPVLLDAVEDYRREVQMHRHRI